MKVKTGEFEIRKAKQHESRYSMNLSNINWDNVMSNDDGLEDDANEKKFSKLYPYRMSIRTELEKLQFEPFGKNKINVPFLDSPPQNLKERNGLPSNESNESQEEDIPLQHTNSVIFEHVDTTNNAANISHIFLNKDMERAHLYYKKFAFIFFTF